MDEENGWMARVLLGALLAGVALAGVSGLVGSIPSAFASMADLSWPPWVGNLANVVQILGGLTAVLAWRSTRRRRD